MRKVKSMVLALLACLTAVCYAANIKAISRTDLCEGDLLFCAKQQGNNITDVTQGVYNLKIDHVAILHHDNTGTFAIEAIHKGVCLTPIDSFIANHEAIICARLKDTTGVASSVERAMKQIGKPYDFFFMPDDSAFYCSELVQKSYLRKNGDLVFKPIPMSFHDKSGRITKFWQDYYERQRLKVPEGEPGSNPGNLSRSNALIILGKLNIAMVK